MSDLLQPGVPHREVWAWAMYDFANSGYTTVVITAVFSAYFVAVVAGNAAWATPGCVCPAGRRARADAISAAGGFLAEADKTGIILAGVLEDGEQIDIPYGEGASIVIPTPGIEVVTSSSELININTASQFELESLPGIGPTTAEKIIAYREENGSFSQIEDIMNVSGIGPGTFDRIKDLITVGG